MLGKIIKNPIFITLLIILAGVGGLIALLITPGSDVPQAPYVERFWGKSDSKVVVTEYADFLCPYCKIFHDTVEKKLKENYGDKIKFVYRHFPIHNGADRAGEAAEAAGTQGKFWEFHDLLFDKQTNEGSDWDRNKFTKYAKDLGLDSNKFNKELSDRIYKKIVADSQQDGKDKGVTGTPTVFLNDKKVETANGSWPDYETLSGAVDKALNPTVTPVPSVSH